MARFKLTIEYEGTRYSGWQVQKNARTVQGELIGAMKKVFGTDDFELYGAGRTDAGVHALQQVAHLEVKTQLAPESTRRKVNDALPADIDLWEVEKAHPRFHARYDALAMFGGSKTPLWRSVVGLIAASLLFLRSMSIFFRVLCH